jgi:hypothetical protein
MKTRYTLIAAILTALMLASPVLGMWHPPPPPDIPGPTCNNGAIARFGVTINNNWTTSLKPYEFAEPADGYCDTLNVTVWLLNVTDLYGYEFKLDWVTTYFSLKSWTVEQLWQSGQQQTLRPFANYTGIHPYVQVVTANLPAVGLNGSFPLATLVFHIDNDVCCPDSVTGWFVVYDLKVSDSCSGIIRLCDTLQGYWIFKPTKAKIWIEPKDEVNSKLPDQFTASILLKNIVKMTDFDIWIFWLGYLHTVDPCGYNGAYTVLLTTTEKDVVINEAVFPTLNRTSSITVWSPECGGGPYNGWYYPANPYGYVHVTVTMDKGVPVAFPLINLTNPSKTIWLFNITFTKCDPWYCGAQPEYTAKPNHDWSLENASTPIYFSDGSISACGQSYAIGGTCVDKVDATYTFAPIPGDLDASGHVDIKDLMIEAAYYGKPLSCDAADIPYSGLPMGFTKYYNLNNDGAIDIYDIVIVAKNFCRTEPSDP